MVKSVDAVLCISEKQRDWVIDNVRKDNIFYMPERIDLERFRHVRKHINTETERDENGRRIDIKYVWHGHAKTYARFSTTLLPYFLQKRYYLKIVGSQTYCPTKRETYHKFKGVTEVECWKRDSLPQELASCDVGVNPDLVDKTHPLYELLAYRANIKDVELWACGLPVAKTIEDVEKYRNYYERVKESKKRLEEVRNFWDAKFYKNDWEELLKKL